MTTTATPPRWKRRLTGLVVVVLFGTLLLFRLLWGADRARDALEQGFDHLAAALTLPTAQRDAAFDAAREAFSTASGNTLGAAMPLLGLEIIARIREGRFDGIDPGLIPATDALVAGDIRTARDRCMAFREASAATLARATQDAHGLFCDFLQALVIAQAR
jgi:hypothetical protein